MQSSYSSDSDNDEPIFKKTRLIAMITDSASGIPRTYHQAMTTPDRHHWQQAINRELGAHTKNGTWIWKNTPIDCRPVGSRWVFTMKDKPGANGAGAVLYKARLVAQGFSQTEGLDYNETFSPVLRSNSLRVLLAIAAHHQCHIHQMDVTTAFLYGDIDVPIYMKPPPGVPGPPGCICFLQKSIYGLKQSPYRWNLVIHEFLLSIGFTRTLVEQGIYLRRFPDKRFVIIGLYVDDLLLIGQSLDDISEVKHALANRFSMKDLGSVRKFLGMDICSNKTDK